MKTTDFITENKFIADDAHAMHQDHEIQMARSDCYNAAKYAIELHKLLKNISEMEGLDGWVSEKITLANDYLRTVAEYLRHEQLEKQSQMPEIFTAESAEAKFAALLNEFAPSVGGGDDGDDGFDEDTLRQLAARWYQGDEDPGVEQVLMAAGWEIGQDEGYEDEPGVFVVMSGDEHGKSYISWPASELQSDVAEQGVAEGAFQDDGKMDWDAWKQKAKKHGAVKFTDTDNKTIAYDKDGKVVSSITWSQKKSGMAEATGYTGTGMHPKVVEVLKQRGFKGPYQLGKLKKWQASLNDIGANPTDEIMVTGNDVDYDEWVVAITPNHYVYGAETGYNTGSAARVIKDTTPVTEQGVAEGPDTGIGSKLPKSDIETFGLQKGRPYKINPPEDFKPGDRKRAVQQLIPTQDKKDHIRSRLGKHVAPALPEQGVAEDRTEVKDKEGRVQSWRDESDWKRSEKKDPRGKVTNMSDKARRETEKLSVKETTSTGGIATVPGVGGGPKVGSLFGGSYAPRTPFAGKKKAKESVIKR
jgi:hypothetical protein